MVYYWLKGWTQLRCERDRLTDMRFDRVDKQIEEIGRNLDRLEQIVERTYRSSKNGEH